MMTHSQDLRNDEYVGKTEGLKKKWKEYLHSLGTVEGVIQNQYKRNGKIDSDFSMEYVCMYPLWIDNRCDLLNHDQNDYDTVSVVGKNYRFSLRRPKGDKDWFIKEIEFEPANKKLATWNFPIYLADPPSHREDPVGYNIFNTLGVGLFGLDSAVNLPYLLSSEWFIINEMKEIEQDGMKQLHLSFEFVLPDFPEVVKKMPDFAKQSLDWKRYTLTGKMILITDYFLVSEAKLHLAYLSFTRDDNIKITYDTETYKTPLPKSYYVFTEYNDYKNGIRTQNTSEQIQNFNLHETKPKDIKRFTLSAYGLPEPDFDNSRRTNRVRYILIGLGAIMIGIALWQMIQKNRKDNYDQ